MKRIISILAVLVTGILISGYSFAADTMLNGAGATFPYPVYSAWAYDYNKVSGVRLNYQSIGSGGGVNQIQNRTVDFGASDAPLQPEELKKSNLLQFPAVIGGVVFVVNIPGVKAGALKLDSDTACQIFIGKITSWTDRKILEMNPTLKLPKDNITVVYRSDGSGTTAIFTDYLSGICPAWKSEVGTGKSVKWPVGIG
ncbi:MAG: phosphate ABC transporter substrate-binding protein PstS, partial [Nitrospira sp.]|nr:phosphate ABC transporter substrate-binding protein PstS [Nitrospira sp.]